MQGSEGILTGMDSFLALFSNRSGLALKSAKFRPLRSRPSCLLFEGLDLLECSVPLHLLNLIPEDDLDAEKILE